MIKILLILILIFNIYFYLDLVLPPKIKVISPKNEEIVDKSYVLFRGYADKRGDLFINEIPILFDDQGYFEKIFYLKKGVNKFIIKEKKFWGQEKIIERKVIYL
ncbi:MAG: hypothetical protein KatS3mg093_145 [Candidatus Parcubacteria bacterium]|nr:MAG: hypothetical protein KatS3mg093_145 [Candidatus Parcubacteria bacterium]